MSGSGGGSGGGGFGGGDDSIDCSTLRYKTTLNSPVAAVIATLKPRDILVLVPSEDDGPLHAIAPNGKIAGSIAGALLMQLLKCIEKAFQYEAIVIKVMGGNVEVEIQPKGV